MTLPLAVSATRLRQIQQEDPMSRWRFASDQQRDLFRYAGQGIETLLRTNNIGGKTAGGAALSICFARGITELDGRTFREMAAYKPKTVLRLPDLGTPNTGLLTIPAYKSEGATDAVVKFLGNWPHKIKQLSNATGGIGAVWIKPNRSRSTNYHEWSKLVIFPDGGVLPKGLRLHYAWGDEPVSMAMWREIRMRLIPGRIFPKYLT